MVFDIIQSRDGFIWIGTKDGLNRYDGSRFEIFSPDPFNPFAIGGSEVQALFEDSKGWIWIKLPKGLDVLDPGSGRFFHLMYEGKPFGNSNLVNFVETPDGAIWFSDNDRIWKASPPKDMLVKAAKQGISNVELPCKAISMSAVSGWSGEPLRTGNLYFTQGKLLVCTNHGLFRIDPATDQLLPEWPTLDYDIKWLAESKSGEILMQVNQANRSLWILVSNGKVLYQKENLPGLNLSMPVFHDSGDFWAYDYTTKNIEKWEPSVFFQNGEPKLEIPPNVLRLENNGSYACTNFMVDKSGIIWVGTTGFGLVKINEKEQKFKTILPGNAHGLFFEDPSGACFTSSIPDKKFLSKSFDRSVPNTDLSMIKDREQRCLTFDPAGNVWWLNRDQIYHMNAATKTKISFPFEGMALICDRNGNLVSVNEKGLHRFDPATKTSQDFPFEKLQKRLSDNSYFLYEDGDGVVWIFGFEGLMSAIPNQSGYRFVQYLNNPTDRNSLSINIVLSVIDDPLEPSRYLWVGTKGGGLNRLNKQSGKFRQFTREQGLPDNVVYGILAQGRPKGSQSPGFIWMSTNKGLCRFDVRAETTKNFTVSDGLQDNEFNSTSYLKARDGSLIFGGVNGINVFHPDSLHFNEHEPITQIVRLKVNNQPFDISGQSSITLSHDQNLLNFEFAALEFTNPAQNQYRYQLVGVDKNWVSLGNKNSIQFANLAPGTYTFKVLGSNNDGKWSERPAELSFVILPPWYASWWAYLLYFAIAVAAIWRYYQYLLRQRFSEQEKLRLQELDNFKSRFFTNITHEFRTPLTVILGMSERVLSEEVTPSHPLTVTQPLTLIKRNGENLLRLVNQILDLAKLESNTLKINYIQGDVLTFIRYIAESLHSLANAQNLILRVESDQAKIVMDYDSERLLQIVHNLLSNAIKFTPSGGKVTLRVHREGQWLHLSVTDTGAGIPADELPQLFERFFQAKNQEHAKAGGTGIGLSLTRELIKVMGGEIAVESTVGVGSTFLVKLPVTNSSVFEEKAVKIEGVTPSHPLKTEPHPVRTPHSEGVTGSHPLTTQTILLIEDNPDVVEYLNACLKDQYNLDFAYNGQAGIEKALESIPDLIVSDVMMPFKDGFEVVEALKNDERTSHIPIVLLTAKADVQSRLTGLRKGADAYLSKPFNQEELLVTADNLLDLRRKLQLKYQQQILAPETQTEPDADVELEDAFLQKVRAVIEAHYSKEDFGLPQLCQKIGMSRSQLFRKMKALTDIAPSDLIRTHRLNKAKALLESGAANVAEAAWEVGFKDPSYFSKLYQEEFGMAPSTTRK